ncbi:MAG: hypothetical protein QME52_07470 [Bacteroidota bacterium]|nr:hypothetical protein [Bacteroidota bacterium]
MSAQSSLVSLFLFFFFFNFILEAQFDSLMVEDTVSIENRFEEIVEQNREDEDSPLLDFLLGDEGNRKIEIRSRFIKRLESPVGIINGAYAGSAIKSYQRIKFRSGEHISGGLLMEKDAGERRFTDFTTGNIAFSNIGPISKIILGDYYIESGQGVVLWRGYDIAKGANVILPTHRKGSGIRQYFSSGENEYFRGAAAHLKLDKFSPMVFYSNTPRSAYLDSSGNITSFYTSGYFRTTSERNKQNNVSERLFGARWFYEITKTNRVGFTFYNTIFSRSLYLQKGNRFADNSYSIYSIDYNYSIASVTLFGEWARSNQVIGGNSGLLFHVSEGFKIITHIRSYPYRFISLHGLAFGERTFNEQGFYIGLQFQPLKYLKISTYSDVFYFPQPQNRLFPSHGKDIFTQMELKPNPRLNILARYRNKISNEPQSQFNDFGFRSSVNGTERKQTIRLNVDYLITRGVKIRGRIDKLYLNEDVSKKREEGIVVFQDLSFNPNNVVSSNLRVAYFHSDSYQSGIYEYERDLDGVFTLPVLYGKGIRWYLLLKYKPFDALTISAKYSDHIRDDIKKIGSGLDQLPTNQDNRIGVQLDIRF